MFIMVVYAFLLCIGIMTAVSFPIHDSIAGPAIGEIA